MLSKNQIRYINEKFEELSKKLGFSTTNELTGKEYSPEEKKRIINKHRCETRKHREKINTYMHRKDYSKKRNQLIESGYDFKSHLKELRDKNVNSLYITYTYKELIGLIVMNFNKNEKNTFRNIGYLPINKFIPNTEYICFTINYNSVLKTLLVPMKEFTAMHSDILQMLISSSYTHLDQENGTMTHILFVMYKKYNFKKLYIKEDFTHTIDALCKYAECWTRYGYEYVYTSLNENNICDPELEKKWYSKSITDHVLDYDPETHMKVLPDEALEIGCSLRQIFVITNLLL
jgi:hypothetical protein